MHQESAKTCLSKGSRYVCGLLTLSGRLAAVTPCFAVDADHAAPQPHTRSAHTPKHKLSHTQSLENEAVQLQKESAMLDSRIQQFSLHADDYIQGPLHKSIRGGSKQHATASANPMASHVQNVHLLKTEYSSHVAKFRDVMKDMRNFLKAYATHYEQYKKHLKDYQLEVESAHLDQSQPPLLKSKADAERLMAAENALNQTFQKMFILERDSPKLSESYICPAYDDLQHEFVEAVRFLETTIKALPQDEIPTVAKDEATRLQLLKQEMNEANKLHSEQMALQNEYHKLHVNLEKMNSDEQTLVQPSLRAPK